MTIAASIDKINDKLANSNQPAVSTIEDALDLLASNIPQGGWGGGGELEPATASTLGGVKIGDGIDVTADGTISAGGLCTVFFGWVDSTNISAFGDFQTALDMVKGGKPVVAYSGEFMENSRGHYFRISGTWVSIYEYSNPDAIQFFVSTTEYYEWTADGVEYKTA